VPADASVRDERIAVLTAVATRTELSPELHHFLARLLVARGDAASLATARDQTAAAVRYARHVEPWLLHLRLIADDASSEALCDLRRRRTSGSRRRATHCACRTWLSRSCKTAATSERR